MATNDVILIVGRHRAPDVGAVVDALGLARRPESAARRHASPGDGSLHLIEVRSRASLVEDELLRLDNDCGREARPGRSAMTEVAMSVARAWLAFRPRGNSKVDL